MRGSRWCPATPNDWRRWKSIALTAWLDVRYDARNGGPVAEFSWEGDDEGDQRSGRGWVALGTAGRLVGHVYIHRGDNSGFVCEPW